MNVKPLPSCPCCGVEKWKYERWGHDKECVWYEAEMYRRATEWCEEPEYGKYGSGGLREDWHSRFKVVVPFLLEQIKHLTKNKVEIHD